MLAGVRIKKLSQAILVPLRLLDARESTGDTQNTTPTDCSNRLFHPATDDKYDAHAPLHQHNQHPLPHKSPHTAPAPPCEPSATPIDPWVL
jgi:hypothetical protein